MITVPGIYTISAAAYHRDPCPAPSLSSSVARILLDKSPLHAWHAHPRLNPNFEPDFDAKFDLGTAAHALLLEGDDSNLVLVEAKDWRTNAAKEARDEANLAGKTALLEKDYSAVTAMVEVARKFVAESEIADAWAQAKSEQTVIWAEPYLGNPELPIWYRARLDRVSNDLGVVVDYKSTTDASPDVFSRQIVRMGYHIQDAFYSRGVFKLTGDMPHFVFLVQETKPPYACSLAACSPMLRDLAGEAVQAAVELWEQCAAKKRWPGYSGRIAWVEAPAWLLAKQGLQE